MTRDQLIDALEDLECDYEVQEADDDDLEEVVVDNFDTERRLIFSVSDGEVWTVRRIQDEGVDTRTLESLDEEFEWLNYEE